MDVRAALAWSDAGQARSDERIIRWMNRVTRPEDRVVASPPLHPIDRYDTFFLWINTFDPGGLDAEHILARLPRLRGYASEARYREEDEAHPPALVVVSGDWRLIPNPSGQIEALTDCFRRNGYVAVRVGTVWFALRPDCYERARRDGLTEPTTGLSAIPAG